MKKVLLLVLFLLTMSMGCTVLPEESSLSTGNGENIKLPPPRLTGDTSLEESLAKRRSIRGYTSTPLSLEEISQLLWAAQGITESWGGRTAPSAGGLYPLEVYIFTRELENLAAGVYKYLPQGHEIIQVRVGDLRSELAKAALDQSWVKEAPVNIVISAVFERTTKKYGERGVNYVYMEAGHAAQNICLQITAMQMGAVTVGAFEDDKVKKAAGMPSEEKPLYIIPIGKIY